MPSIFLLAIVALHAAIGRSNAYIVTGATGNINKETGQRPFRQDIVKMYKAAGPTWDLFLLSLQAIQAKNQSDQLSWYQVSGEVFLFGH